ncbi:MAG: hypothetical protein ACKPJJ_35975, partial [Planctomycetaceae bacterium]
MSKVDCKSDIKKILRSVAENWLTVLRYPYIHLPFSSPTADSVAQVPDARGEGHRLSKRTSKRSSGKNGICFAVVSGTTASDVLVRGCPEFSKPGKPGQDCHNKFNVFWRN